MKFFTKKIDQLKTLYQKNKLLGVLLGLGIAILFISFLPEVVLVFTPQIIFQKIWSLEYRKFYKALLLVVAYFAFGVLLYYLFVVFENLFHILKIRFFS
jgi:hypothetical protein